MVSLFDRPPPLPGGAPEPSSSSRAQDEEHGQQEEDFEDGELELELDLDGGVAASPAVLTKPVPFEMPRRRPASPEMETSRKRKGAKGNVGKKGPKRKKEQKDRPSRKELPKKETRSEPPPRPPVACKFYLEGKCRRGADCEFSHDVERPKKTDLCKFYLTGNCMRGDACLFSHDTKAVPCFFLQTNGRCANGDQCRFSHSFPPDAPISRVFRDRPASDAEQPSVDPQRSSPLSDSEDDAQETKQEEHIEPPFSFALPASHSSADSATREEQRGGMFPAYHPPASALAQALHLDEHSP